MITVERIRTSDGKRPRQPVTQDQLREMYVLQERVSAIFAELGITKDVVVTDGLRPENADYGAKRSAHKEGKAVDIRDPGHALALCMTNEILRRHKLRREDTDATPGWLHLDTREPYGVFKP